METKRYECTNCVNRATPICEICTRIIKPGGKETKPTYYIAQSVGFSSGDERKRYDAPMKAWKTEELASYLMRMLRLRIPLPTSVVLIYNRKSEKE